MPYFHHICTLLRLKWHSFNYIILLRSLLLQRFTGTWLKNQGRQLCPTPNICIMVVDWKTSLHTFFCHFFLYLVTIFCSCLIVIYDHCHPKALINKPFCCLDWKTLCAVTKSNWGVKGYNHLPSIWKEPQKPKSLPATVSVCCPRKVWSEFPCLPPTRFHHNQIADRGTYCALCGVKTSPAWLAPHLFSLMEGGGPLGEGNHVNALTEWQACYIVRKSPLALTLLYTSRLLKQRGIKRNQK